MSTATAAVLDEARALIENGWCRGAFELNSVLGSRYCASGALIVALGDEEGDVRESAFGALCSAVGVPDSPSVWEWNDAPERTQAEVIEVFRKAAELARGTITSPIDVRIEGEER